MALPGRLRRIRKPSQKLFVFEVNKVVSKKETTNEPLKLPKRLADNTKSVHDVSVDQSSSKHILFEQQHNGTTIKNNSKLFNKKSSSPIKSTSNILKRSDADKSSISNQRPESILSRSNTSHEKSTNVKTLMNKNNENLLQNSTSALQPSIATRSCTKITTHSKKDESNTSTTNISSHTPPISNFFKKKNIKSVSKLLCSPDMSDTPKYKSNLDLNEKTVKEKDLVISDDISIEHDKEIKLQKTKKVEETKINDHRSLIANDIQSESDGDNTSNLTIKHPSKKTLNADALQYESNALDLNKSIGVTETQVNKGSMLNVNSVQTASDDDKLNKTIANEIQTRKDLMNSDIWVTENDEIKLTKLKKVSEGDFELKSTQSKRIIKKQTNKNGDQSYLNLANKQTSKRSLNTVAKHNLDLEKSKETSKTRITQKRSTKVPAQSDSDEDWLLTKRIKKKRPNRINKSRSKKRKGQSTSDLEAILEVMADVKDNMSYLLDDDMREMLEIYFKLVQNEMMKAIENVKKYENNQSEINSLEKENKAKFMQLQGIKETLLLEREKEIEKLEIETENSCNRNLIAEFLRTF